MKKVFLFFAALMMVSILIPSKTNAQAKIEVPATIALDVYDPEDDVAGDHIVIHQEGRVVLTPSGNLQLKIGFDLSGIPAFSDLIPSGDEQKVTVHRIAVRVYLLSATVLAEDSEHFEEYDVNGIIYPDGMIYFVVNWRGIDQILGW